MKRRKRRRYGSMSKKGEQTLALIAGLGGLGVIAYLWLDNQKTKTAAANIAANALVVGKAALANSDFAALTAAAQRYQNAPGNGGAVSTAARANAQAIRGLVMRGG